MLLLGKVALTVVLVAGGAMKCESIGPDGTYGDGEYPIGYSIEAGTYKAVSGGNFCKVVVERNHLQATSFTRRFHISVDDSNVRLSGGCKWKRVGR